jgi:hypothetical protein
MSDYPAWVCQDCALANGGRIIPGHVSTHHDGKCDLCGQVKSVTEPRDYGHLPKLEKKQ